MKKIKTANFLNKQAQQDPFLPPGTSERDIADNAPYSEEDPLVSTTNVSLERDWRDFYSWWVETNPDYPKDFPKEGLGYLTAQVRYVIKQNWDVGGQGENIVPEFNIMSLTDVSGRPLSDNTIMDNEEENIKQDIIESMEEI